MLLAFQNNPPSTKFERKTSSQIFIFGRRLFVGTVRQFLCCECKQYLLTDNLSVGQGLGRIADILVSSRPILQCPPRPLSSKRLRLCLSMPCKFQSQSIIVLQVRLEIFPILSSFQFQLGPTLVSNAQE